MQLNDHLIKLPIVPRPTDERGWHNVAASRGPNDAWRGLVMSRVREAIPGWQPQFNWKVFPGSFDKWDSPYEVQILFEAHTDKERLQFLWEITTK
jgi:hypothetical protein